MPKKLVLIIEDEESVQVSIQMLLEHCGFIIQQAFHGKDALEMLQTLPLPDLILLDLKMPEMDGWQFLEHKIADPKLKHIPTIVISSLGDNVRGHPGVDAICPKPFDKCDLIGACEALLAS